MYVFNSMKTILFTTVEMGNFRFRLTDFIGKDNIRLKWTSQPKNSFNLFIISLSDWWTGLLEGMTSAAAQDVCSTSIILCLEQLMWTQDDAPSVYPYRHPGVSKSSPRGPQPSQVFRPTR